MEALQHDGVWWDPTSASEQWIGTLRVDTREGVRLALTVPTTRLNPFPPLGTYERIFGLTTTGVAVTLLNCFEQSSSGTFGPAPRRIEIFANSAIVGFHCDSGDPLLSAASLTFQHLTEWWGYSGIESDLSMKAPDLAVRYTSPSPLVVYDDGAWRVSLHTGVTGSTGRHRIALREEMSVDLEASTPQPLSEFQQRIQAFGDFLSIACSTRCAVDELVLRPPWAPGERRQRGTYHAVPIYERQDRRSSSVIVHALLRSDDIAPRSRDALSAWFSHAERLHDVRALYFLGVYGAGFVEGKLLALTHATEAFHRRFYPPAVYMARKDFETQVLPALKVAIPEVVGPDHRRAIKDRLQYFDEFSAFQRLKALFAEHVDALHVLLDDPVAWVRPILTHRNAFTHFPDPPPERTCDPERVLRYNVVLRLLLEACFLKVIGFTAEEIATIARRSETYRQFKVQFFRDAATSAPETEPEFG